jgi:DNA-binding GntR family transcriptional regulator
MQHQHQSGTAALLGLEGEGLVAIMPNRDVRVRAVDADFVRNIFDLRGLIEPYPMWNFAEFAMGDDISRLVAAQQTCDEAATEGDYAAFHDETIDRHHNRWAVRIMKQHAAWIRSLSRNNPLTLAHMRRSNDGHWEMVKAIRMARSPRSASIWRIHGRCFRADQRVETVRK